jgi:hypothetical protein
MLVEVELLDFGYKAVIIKDKKVIGEMLGVTLANLYKSLFQVYRIDLYGTISLN